MKIFGRILLVATAMFCMSCVMDIYEGFKEAGEASGLGGRIAHRGETPCNY